MAKIFISTADLVIPTGRQTKETNAEIETQPAIVEDRTRKCSTQFKYLHNFLYFSIIKLSCFISPKRQFLISSYSLNLN